MQQYSTYKPSNVEWLGDVPSHWKVERIKDVVQLRTEKTSEKSEQKDYLELEDIEQNTGNIIGLRDTSEVSSDVTLFKEGDVLFGKLRPYLAKYWLATIDGKCTGEIIALNCLKVKNTFFKYFVGSQLFIEQCTTVSYGAKMPRVDWTRQIAYFYIALPSRAEQTAIAAFLDQATANIDKVISTKQKQLEKLEQYKQSKIHECVTKGLNPDVTLKPSGIDWIGDVPNHWKVEKLKQSVEVKDGTHDTPYYEEDGIDNYPFVTSKDIHDNEIDFSATKFISAEFYRSYDSRSNVRMNDIIMPMIGTIGNSAIVKTEKKFAIKNLALFKTSEAVKILPNYLFYYLESDFNKMQFEITSKGGVQSFMSLSSLRNLYFLRPPLGEQKELALYLDTFYESIFKEKNIINQQIEKLKQYRKCLIHECVTGKRKVFND
jgi:type I restriction enzyme, S subunit